MFTLSKKFSEEGYLPFDDKGEYYGIREAMQRIESITIMKVNVILDSLDVI